MAQAGDGVSGTLAEARAAAAAALSEVPGVHVRAYPLKGPSGPRAGDGWIVVPRVEVATFRSCLATLNAVVILGASDETAAEEKLDALAVELVGAATAVAITASLSSDVLTLADGGAYYAAVMTLTMEVN